MAWKFVTECALSSSFNPLHVLSHNMASCERMQGLQAQHDSMSRDREPSRRRRS